MTYIAHSVNEVLSDTALKTATGIYITMHGHFYQPPRENPYLNTIERQPSAYPYHNWNERIHHECYRPNAFARILNDKGEVLRIVNNYEYLSFNIGPTLMSWLQTYDVEVYQRIIEADRKSSDRLDGHGNAIAQVYNHIILPLANEKDKYTQIRWGKADFQNRFGRRPEGMWLAETAVDRGTLRALIDEEIKFIVLAPSQALRCRLLEGEDNPEPQWQETGGGQIDPTRPYRCFIEDGRYIDIFFYDGPISRDMGFNEVLNSTAMLVKRLGQAVKGDHRPSQLINVATDGETFGHHKGGTEKCLAYAFTEEFPKRDWNVTNYAHYLSICPPTWEVELKPVTAWSCFHGVDRWQDNCGCGGGGDWHQLWRKPLRAALNWLRDELAAIYEKEGAKYFLDPWYARDQYIEIILDRGNEKVDSFLSRHQNHPLRETEIIDALRLLEMQRHSLLMFTSCGWFFEEISRPEGTQILRYAARALELAGEVAGVNLENQFVQHLSFAPSNVDLFKDGGAIYRQLVTPAKVNFEQVAAHYAISSLFTNYLPGDRVYCYSTRQLDYQKQKIGSLTLGVGHINLVSDITRESKQLVFAVLHLSGRDFHCCIQSFSGRLNYARLKEALFNTLREASAASMIVEMSRWFNDRFFALKHLFAEERHRIMQQVTEETKKRLDQLYTQVYRDNYGILVAFQMDEIPVPQELQVAAEIAISHRCLQAIIKLEQCGDDQQETLNYLAELAAIASEASHLRCRLNIPEGKKILERLILNRLWQLLPAANETQAEILIELLRVGEELGLGLALDRVQELYYNYLQGAKKSQARWVLRLGEILKVQVT
ncbi:MAG: hypothetical protein N5P05_001726 [Chroococcopsis gigantea SAG 12.99]|jgi:alpha-amylase/alpha-mannosidase (GH57 family)|nr:DUF3536 domain-containing protein [Chlorogloea purpurea SAG 13.99]MDV3000120.1 hypothetical protein [Chroococcopsis gigantea SAG 12.99]